MMKNSAFYLNWTLAGLVLAASTAFVPADADPACQIEVPTGSSIEAISKRVADWQVENLRADYGRKHDGANRLNAWTYGAMYVGMCKWAEAYEDDRYFEFLKSIGQELDWSLLPSMYHADDQIVGYSYLTLYGKYGDDRMIRELRDKLDSIIAEPSAQPMDFGLHQHTERWTWCDALFMAPPVWAKLSRVTGDPKYRNWMFEEFQAVTDHLLDDEEALYFRDSRFFEERDHGKKIFWSRGNGWVFAGLPLILESLEDGEQKDYFVALFKKMAPKVVELQKDNGLWPMSLLLGDLYTTPETSGSAFFVYGLAWGLNNGLLEGEEYRAAVLKGWNSLVGLVDEDGMLGYVQPIGAAPGEAFPDQTEVYGIGAFLLAGTELLKLVEGD